MIVKEWCFFCLCVLCVVVAVLIPIGSQWFYCIGPEWVRADVPIGFAFSAGLSCIAAIIGAIVSGCAYFDVKLERYMQKQKD